MKAENLHSLKRTVQTLVRWMCGVSLKDRKRSVNLYTVQSFGYTECGGCGEAWQIQVV